MRILASCAVLVLYFAHPSFALHINKSALKQAIYLAEGSRKHPYGVLSVKCSGKKACGKIVDNSIRNSLKRYSKTGGKGDYKQFIAFFGEKWAPSKCRLKNDPNGLNLNWVGNVTKLYEQLI